MTHYIVSIGIESPLDANTEVLTDEVMRQLGFSKKAKTESYSGKQLPPWMYAYSSKKSSAELADRLQSKLHAALGKELNVLVFATSELHVAHTAGSKLQEP